MCAALALLGLDFWARLCLTLAVQYTPTREGNTMQGTDNTTANLELVAGKYVGVSVGQAGWAAYDAGKYLADGYDTKEGAIRQAKLMLAKYDTPAERLRAVATAFEAYGGGEALYVDEDHTEPLWDMCYPSADVLWGDYDGYADNLNPQRVNAECATRVAAAIAVMAYGVQHLQDAPQQ